MEVDIRRAGSGHDDREAFVRIDQEAFPTAEGATGSRRRFDEELARPWGRIWIASRGAAAVGFLLGWHVADEFHLLSLATNKDARRTGVGRALVETTLDYARANAVRLVLLEVRPSNAAARALYGTMGFIVTGMRLRYYDDGEDGLEMRRDLSLPDALSNDALAKDL